MPEQKDPKGRSTDAFVSPDTPTLADVLEAVLASTRIADGRRRDLASALRTLARMLDKELHDVPANTDWLALKLRRLHPTQVGISKKRFANVKSAVMAALRLAGVSSKRTCWLPPMTPEWQTLWDRIPDKHDRWKLSRFIRWCGASGIVPTSVTDEVVQSFRQALIEETLVDQPDRTVANAVRTWNQQRHAVSGWPDLALTVPRRRQPWTFDLATFTQSFQEDVERWMQRLSGADPLDDDGPVRPARPATLKHRRFQIRMMASALVRQGHDNGAIISLAYLVEIKNLKDGLRFMIDRAGGQPTEAIHGLAMGLKAIARHHVQVDDEHLEQLRRICARLNRQVDGLREKNRERLAQFDDEHNLALLLHLPQKLIHTASRHGSRPRIAALLLQAATAIEILLYAPIRIGNLANLDIERHLRWVRVRREQCLHISVPHDEVKNDKPLHHELGPESAAVVRRYLEDGRPLLLDRPSHALFPMLDGRPKRPGGLSALIKKVIFEHTGLVVNAHLFRSIAGKLHSQAVPGDYVTLSHVLNDTLGTTMKSYAQFEQRSALRHYQNSVNTLRRQLTSGGKVRLSARNGQS